MTASVNETIRPGYVKIMRGIYRRGQNAAADYHGKTPPKNPYKMTNFRKMWQQGFDDGTKAIQESLEELEELAIS